MPDNAPRPTQRGQVVPPKNQNRGGAPGGTSGGGGGSRKPGTANVHGKDYLMVMPRLYAATPEEGETELKPRRGVDGITIEHLDRCGRLIVKATILFKDGSTFEGSSEAKLTGARPGSPDATNPIECAETSAIGRALAFAGWPGSEDGFAGAEEMRTAVAVAAAAHTTAATVRKDPHSPTRSPLRENELTQEHVEAFEDVPTGYLHDARDDAPPPPMRLSDKDVEARIVECVSSDDPPYPYKLPGVPNPTPGQYYDYLLAVAAVGEVQTVPVPKNAIDKWFNDNGGRLKATLIEKGWLEGKPS